jgi:hypothetical protein
MEGREQYLVIISNQKENLDDNVNFSRVWETTRRNIKILEKQSRFL